MPAARDLFRRAADARDDAGVALGAGEVAGVTVGEAGTTPELGGTMLGPPPSTSQPQKAAATASATKSVRPAPPRVRALISASDVLRAHSGVPRPRVKAARIPAA